MTGRARRDAPERRVDRLLGIHAVLEALRSGARPFERIAVLRGRRDGRIQELLEAARGRGVPVRFEDRRALDRLAAGGVHQGVVAVAGSLRYASEDEILGRAGDRAFLLVLDRVQDPRNLGAVVRSAAAAGVHGVFVASRGAVAPTASAHRAAAGAMDRIPLARAGNIATLLKRLKERGIWTVGLDPAGDGLWGGFDLALPLALVVGGEGSGLRRLVRDRCEVVLSIPMPGGGGSLNLSAAAAVALFEVVRRRRGAGRSP